MVFTEECILKRLLKIYIYVIKGYGLRRLVAVSWEMMENVRIGQVFSKAA